LIKSGYTTQVYHAKLFPFFSAANLQNI